MSVCVCKRTHYYILRQYDSVIYIQSDTSGKDQFGSCAVCLPRTKEMHTGSEV